MCFRWLPNEGKSVIRPLRTATRRSRQPGGFGDSCLPDSIFHGALDYRFVEVMPTPDAGLAVDVVTACRKNPLPTPLALGIRILALDGMGERHAARSRGKTPFVQGFDFVEVLMSGSLTTPGRIVWRSSISESKNLG